MVSLITAFILIFSSRRRHTRLQGDWSSDVCSSDLDRLPPCRGRRVGSPRRTRESGARSAWRTAPDARSEERRVGKEYRSSQPEYHAKQIEHKNVNRSAGSLTAAPST